MEGGKGLNFTYFGYALVSDHEPCHMLITHRTQFMSHLFAGAEAVVLIAIGIAVAPPHVRTALFQDYQFCKN
jgi:hypothetical protein